MTPKKRVQRVKKKRPPVPKLPTRKTATMTATRAPTAAVKEETLRDLHLLLSKLETTDPDEFMTWTKRKDRRSWIQTVMSYAYTISAILISLGIASGKIIAYLIQLLAWFSKIPVDPTKTPQQIIQCCCCGDDQNKTKRLANAATTTGQKLWGSLKGGVQAGWKAADPGPTVTVRHVYPSSEPWYAFMKTGRPVMAGGFAWIFTKMSSGYLYSGGKKVGTGGKTQGTGGNNQGPGGREGRGFFTKAPAENYKPAQPISLTGMATLIHDTSARSVRDWSDWRDYAILQNILKWNASSLETVAASLKNYVPKDRQPVIYTSGHDIIKRFGKLSEINPSPQETAKLVVNLNASSKKNPIMKCSDEKFKNHIIQNASDKIRKLNKMYPEMKNTYRVLG